MQLCLLNDGAMSRALYRSLVQSAATDDAPLQVLEVTRPFSCWDAGEDVNVKMSSTVNVQAVEGDAPQPLCDRVLAAAQGNPGQHTVLVLGGQQLGGSYATTRYLLQKYNGSFYCVL
jgi:hypothetical protein